MFVRLAAVAAALVCFLAVPFAAAPTPRATLVSATQLALPGAVDSNSPVMWDLDEGQRRLFVLTSHSGVPSIAEGSAIDRLSAATPITITPHPDRKSTRLNSSHRT